MKNGDYELVVAPPGYPGILYRDRYCYEHHLIWWQHTGEFLKPDMQIHHVNGDKRDNRIENLELLTTEQHHKRHPRSKQVVLVQCPNCNERVYRERRQTSLAKKSVLTFCSRMCAGAYYGKHPSKEDIDKSRKVNYITI